jgi:cytochrome P450
MLCLRQRREERAKMATQQAARESPFYPPAPYPPPGSKATLAQALKIFRSQIEGLPAAVFEADAWQPPFPGTPLYIMSPEAIQTVLLTEADQFPHGDLFARIMRPVWGTGMLLAEPEAWQTQRRAAAPAFRAAEVVGLTPFFVASAQAALGRWSALAATRIDVSAEMQRITFDIILDTMLSGAERFDRETLRQSALDFFADVNRMRFSYFIRSDAYHARRPSTVSRRRAALADHITRLVAARRTEAPRGDLVDMLLAARDPETGAGLTDAELSDNLLGFIMAGYETTSVALTWSLYLIAAHAKTQERLNSEIAAVLGENDVTPETLARLVFTRQVVSEAMRLYPPAYQLTRVSAAATELAGHKVKAGQRLIIPIYAVHRRAAVWADPHAFDPDRFAPDRPAPPRYAYLPFGGGPRICIGAAFAMTEAVTILATLLRAVRFAPPPRETIWPQTGLALYPRGGLPMTLAWRQH